MSPAPASQPDSPAGARPPSGESRRIWTQRLILVSLVALFLLSVLELLLHLRPEIFGEQRANEIFSRYDTRPGGIFVREKRTKMRFMWPDFATENYWNGYRWQHATDARGFRNPPATPIAVLLLGDSLIYGHGVEETATVAHFLRAEHGVGAYNMGRQGASLYDEYVLLRTFLPELTPQSVVLFVFLNDFDDLEVYRTPNQIATMPEIDQLDYAAIRQWAGGLHERRPSALRQWLERWPSLRLLRSAAKELRSLALTTPAWAAEFPADPPFLAPLLDPDRRARLGTYYTRILGDLAQRCRSRGIDLSVVYLGGGSDPQSYPAAQGMAVDLVRRAAGESGAPFFDSRELFSGCGECFLPRDGHFTAAGHRRLARFVAGTVLAREPALD
jgi:hypothetical protein